MSLCPSQLDAELNAFIKFRDSPALKRCLALAQDINNILQIHWDSSFSIDQLISEQFDFWQDFANVMIASQKEYIGPQLGQGANKADHSLEVGEGVALLFENLSKIIGYEPAKQELDYIRFRGHLHDGGRILNLSGDSLDQKHSELGGKSAREVAINAAQNISNQYSGSLWCIEDVRDAICYAAISNRSGLLYNEAVSIDPKVRKIKNYFYREDVHNPLYLQGLYNYTAHHNIPDSPLGGSRNFNNISTYGIIDYLAIMLDKASACTGGASYLDEIALHMIVFARQGVCDSAYVRYFLEYYGLGKSLIEQWFMTCAQKGFCRVPGGVNNMHLDRDRLIVGLESSFYGEKEFPRLYSDWSPYPTEDARKDLALKLQGCESIHSHIRDEIRNFPYLTKERIIKDILVSKTQRNSSHLSKIQMPSFLDLNMS